MDKKRILLVDDEQELVNMIKMRLEFTGYEVISANDGEAALATAKKEKPDLIVLDLMLPKMAGYEVCRTLKADEEYKHIPIILLSGKAQDADKAEGAKAGANAYVTKPFEPKAFLGKIQELLGT